MLNWVGLVLEVDKNDEVGFIKFNLQRQLHLPNTFFPLPKQRQLLLGS